jgi:hypothetical protein
MTLDQKKFLTLKDEKGGNFTFGDNASTRIIGKGTLVLIMERLKNRIYCMLKG